LKAGYGDVNVAAVMTSILYRG